MNNTDLYKLLLEGGQPGLPSPALIGADSQIWYLEQGHIDFFLQSRAQQDSARHHVLRFEGGEILVLPEFQDPDWQVLAVPGLDAQFRLHSVADWENQEQPLRDALLHSVQDSKRVLARIAPGPGALPPSVNLKPVLPGQEGEPGRWQAGQENTWIEVSAGEAQLLGQMALPLDTCIPLPGLFWITAGKETSWRALPPPDWARSVRGVQACMVLLLRWCAYAIAHREQAEVARMERKADIDQRAMHEVLGDFASILDHEAGRKLRVGSGDRMLDACQILGQHIHIRFKAPPPPPPGSKGREPLKEIATASGVRMRLVVLPGQWWQDDYGAFLAFDGKTQAAFVMVREKGAYTCINPETGLGQKVTPELAAQLMPFAYVFYRSLPNQVLHAWDLIKFVGTSVRKDLWLVLAVGLCSALLGMALPIASGHLFENVFPAADRGQMLQVVTILFVASLVSLLFNTTRAFALLALESRAGNDLQAAIWDRVLKLPPSFFRDYQAGDLASRINGINDMRRVLSGSFIGSLLASLFSVVNLGLLFYYSSQLALIACGLILLAVVVNLSLGYAQVRQTRAAAKVEGRLSAMVYEYLTGIAKLRTAGAEWRAFRNWGMLFAEQKRMNWRVGLFLNVSTVFARVFPLLANIGLFAAIYWLFYAAPDRPKFATGDFIAFNAAFISVSTACLGLVKSGLDLLQILPLYERTQPILACEPEGASDKPFPGQLQGAIEVSHLRFGYAPDLPLILDDVSLSIKPGEFVALVGSSGSGKSTLLRLLLGFEKPLQGGIYYDGQNLDDVDITAVRRQLGVVLQGGQLMNGDIFNNIIGSTSLTLADAWAAARACGLDKDIEAMPMGMHTMIGNGGGALSGGQRQRLLIARVIVGKPRIIFFDEATSALDNQSQAVVSSSMEKLRATRVVIAHRLSTIQNADRIYVLDKGKIVETGTYQELMQKNGLFAELAKRQIA